MFASIKPYRILLLLGLAAVLVTACGPQAPATPSAAEVQSAVQTSVAMTMEAQQAQAPQPTATLIPTETPLPPTETSVPTPFPVFPTPTPYVIAPPSSGSGGSGGSGSADPKPYQCLWVSQSPADYSVLVPRQSFDMHWKIRNTGTKTWTTPDVDLVFVSGVQMATKGNTFDIANNVGVGHAIEFVLDMEAPKDPGVYNSTWGLKVGGDTFCIFDFGFSVREK